MGIDVSAETVIHRAREDVAAFAMNAENDPAWIDGIQTARPLTEPPLAAGARAERVAKFMGRRIDYVLEVAEYEPAALLVMRSIKAPFPMKVTYEFTDAPDGTRTRIRVEGGPVGLSRIATPFVGRMVQHRISGDLARLKALLEATPGQP